MSKRILHVVSNVAHYADPSQPTGLWLSELTHAYDVFAAKGYTQRIVSPRGGVSPLEPRALKWPLLDASAKAWLDDPDLMALLASTARPEEIDPAEYDAIYFTGGHAVMWDSRERRIATDHPRHMGARRHRVFRLSRLLRAAQHGTVAR